MDKENGMNNSLNTATKEILEMNNAALQLILEDNIDNALEILKDAEKKIIKNKNFIQDPKINIIINHNLACCYQKIKNIQKCIFHLEKVNTEFDSFLETKHKIKIDQTFFLDKILSENPQPSVLLGDFILELRFCAKFHLQMCAAYSQNNNNREAINHAKLAALICQDNISKTYFLYNQTKKDLYNEKKYSPIFCEKVKENEPIILSLYNYIINISNNFLSSFKEENKVILTTDKISSFITNKTLKISTRNILGVIKNDDWLNLFNIGNIMFLCAMSYDDLDLDSDPKYELLRDAIIEKILMLTVAFFSISNEIRFLNVTNPNKGDNGAYYHSKALEIACLYLPPSCPIIKHYVSSYCKYYGNGNQMSQLEVLLNKCSFLSNQSSNSNFDILKDPILNIGDKEIKIVETFSSSSTINNNSMNNTGLIRSESGQAKTERKREIKSALTGRSIKGKSVNHSNKQYSRSKNKNNNTKESFSPGVMENSKNGTINNPKRTLKNTLIWKRKENNLL